MLVGRGVGGQSLQGALETSPERWAETHPLQSLEGKTEALRFLPEGVHPNSPFCPGPQELFRVSEPSMSKACTSFHTSLAGTSQQVWAMKRKSLNVQ